MTTPVHQFTYLNQVVRFAVWNPDDVIQRHHVAGEFYELDDLEYHRSLIPVGATVVDVGANVGNHSIYYAYFTRASRVIAIEASSQCFSMLEKNLELNPRARAKCSTVNIAVGDKQGSGAVSPGPANNLGMTRLNPSADAAGTRVRVDTLDSLLADERGVTFIKIDVEGMEPAVLVGAANTIKMCRPVLSVECQIGSEGKLKEPLRELNYRVERTFWHHQGVRNYVLLPD